MIFVVSERSYLQRSRYFLEVLLFGKSIHSDISNFDIHLCIDGEGIADIEYFWAEGQLKTFVDPAPIDEDIHLSRGEQQADIIDATVFIMLCAEPEAVIFARVCHHEMDHLSIAGVFHVELEAGGGLGGQAIIARRNGKDDLSNII